MTIFLNVEDNTAPNFSLTLERDSTVIDLTGASVKLYITNERTGVATNTGHESCTVTSPATGGIVTYAPLAADFPTGGRYLCDVEITHQSGKIERLFEQVLVVVRDKV